MRNRIADMSAMRAIDQSSATTPHGRSAISADAARQVRLGDRLPDALADVQLSRVSRRLCP
jgi:hypothetical protein